MTADRDALQHRIEFFADVQGFVEQFREPLKTDLEFRRRLTYRHSELGVVIYLMDAQAAFADEVLGHIARP